MCHRLLRAPPARPPRPARLPLQIGVTLVVVEITRKNKEDAAKKEKEAAEKLETKELHERHLATERVGGPAAGRGWAGGCGWVGRWSVGGGWRVIECVGMGPGLARWPDLPALPLPHPCPARAGLQEAREQMRTLSRQLHQFDERLQYMEQAMGRKRSWLPLFGR